MLHAELLQEEEEFQEADILWPEAAADLQESPRLYFSQIGIDDVDDDDDSSSSEHQAPLKLQVRHKAASSPIDIPGQKKVVFVGATAARGAGAQPAGSSKSSASHAGGGVGAGSAVIGSHVFVPPHVIVDRRAKRDKAMMMTMLIVPSGRASWARKVRE